MFASGYPFPGPPCISLPFMSPLSPPRSEIAVLPSCPSTFTIIMPCVEEESKICAIPEEPDAANMPPVIWALHEAHRQKKVRDSHW